MPIGWLAQEFLRADDTARARAVVHHRHQAPGLSQMLPKKSRHHVSRAASGCEADDAHLLRRPPGKALGKHQRGGGKRQRRAGWANPKDFKIFIALRIPSFRPVETLSP